MKEDKKLTFFEKVLNLFKQEQENDTKMYQFFKILIFKNIENKKYITTPIQKAFEERYDTEIYNGLKWFKIISDSIFQSCDFGLFVGTNKIENELKTAIEEKIITEEDLPLATKYFIDLYMDSMFLEIYETLKQHYEEQYEIQKKHMNKSRKSLKEVIEYAKMFEVKNPEDIHRFYYF